MIIISIPAFAEINCGGNSVLIFSCFVMLPVEHEFDKKLLPSTGLCILPRVRYHTPAKDSLFFNRCPGLVWVVRFHLPDDLCRVRSNVLLVNLALLIDNKGHHP